MFVKCVSVMVAILLPQLCIADTVSVPFGTRVFIELDQEVVSKHKLNRVGSIVHAHVWKDVVIDGHTVVEAGTHVMVQVSHIKTAKVAGIKGNVELKALQVAAIDGSDLMLTGGYDQSGKSLMALSITLAVVIFAPLIFIKGKQAKLHPGTVFDAMVVQKLDVAVDDSKPAMVELEPANPLEVTVLYEILEQMGEKKVKTLPLQIQMDGEQFDSARVTHVNDVEVKPIPLEVGEVSLIGEDVFVAAGTVDLKKLGKNLNRGFNWFTVDVGGVTDEVMLDLEL